MKQAILIAALTATSTSAIAQDWAHCYTGEAPSNAPVSSAETPPMSGFGDIVGIAAARNACGTAGAADQAAIEARLVAAECSPNSDIAGYANGYLSRGSSDVAGEMREVLGLDQNGFNAFCAAIEVCEPGATGYSEECVTAFRGAIGG